LLVAEKEEMNTPADSVLPLLLLHGDQACWRLSSFTARWGICDYLFLTDQPRAQAKWSEALTEHNRIDIGAGLNKVAEDLQASFLTYLNELSTYQPSPAWWLTRISEQNPWVSDLFINCCKIEYVRRIFHKRPQNRPLIVIDENSFLLKDIEHTLLGNNINCIFFGYEKLRYDQYKVKVCFVYKLLKELLHNALLWGAALATRRIWQKKSDNVGPGSLLHTYTDETYFGPDGSPRDRYFGALVYWLAKKDEPLYILPQVMVAERSARQAYQWFRTSNMNYIIPEDYYRLSDYLQALRITWQAVRLKFKGTSFCGINVENILEYEKWHHAPDTLGAALYYLLPYRLREAGFKFTKMYDVFEGMVMEKALLLGMKKNFPQIYVIGYQHSMFSKRFLCHFTHTRNTSQRILPDRIVCNGTYSAEILLKAGLPATIIPGCALRYQHLLEGPSQIQHQPHSGQILVALPLQEVSVVNLLQRLALTSQTMKSTKFLLKPHPMSSSLDFDGICRQAGWAANYTVVSGEMRDWLPKTDVVISSGSAAILEAIAAGIATVVVGNEFGLDMNPLDWIDHELIKAYYEPQEIKARVQLLSGLGYRDRKMIMEYGRELASMMLIPVSESSLEAFG
jgi:hypothetical protein